MGESLENGQDSPAPYVPDQDTAKATNICQSAGCVRGRERTIEASTCLVSISESLSLPGSYNLKLGSFKNWDQFWRKSWEQPWRESRVEGSGPSKLFKSSFLVLVSISSFLQAQP